MRILFFLLFPMFSFSQEIVTTSTGKKVILNNNGTWEYIQTTDKENIALKCEDIIGTSHDKMTGKSSIDVKDFITVGDKEEGLNILLLYSDKTLIFSISVNGKVGCIDAKDKMYVLFRDGTRLELLHNAKFNCSGDFTVFFRNAQKNTKEWDVFKSKEVETIRISGSSGSVEKDFLQEQSKKLQKTFECFSENM
jgi:hypothetical protein